MLKNLAVIVGAALAAFAAVQISLAQAPAGGAGGFGGAGAGAEAEARAGAGAGARDGAAGGAFSIIAQTNSANVWVLDARQGRLTVCQPPAAADQGPACAAWTQVE